MRHALTVALVCVSVSAIAQDRFHHGAVNPAVTQSNIRQTICDPRWRYLERPEWSYTNAIKQRWVRQRGGNPGDYELDHIIPICAGGDPHDEENLQLRRGRRRARRTSWRSASAKPFVTER
jgi:hypothetical protein